MMKMKPIQPRRLSLCLLLVLLPAFLFVGCAEKEEPEPFGGSHLVKAEFFEKGADTPTKVVEDAESLEKIETWMGNYLTEDAFQCESKSCDTEAIQDYREGNTVVILTLDTLSKELVGTDEWVSSHMKVTDGYTQILLGSDAFLVNAGGQDYDFSKETCWIGVKSLPGLYADIVTLFE